MAEAGIILVVDDEANNRKTLQSLLQPLGHQVELAVDGTSALDRASALAPDLILLDVMMPGLDGFEVCRRVRANPALAEVPVILVTALDDRASRLSGLEAGADDFVTKPFDRTELRARVQTVMRLNRYRRLVTERQRFAWLVEQADDGYLVVAGEADAQVLYANPRARDLLELPAVGPARLADVMAAAQRRYSTEPDEAGRDWRAPFHLVRPETATERSQWLHVEELVLPRSSGLERLFRLRDVTAQMGLRYEMWSFSVLAGHKLRAPLTAIQVSLDLAPDLLAEADLDTARSLLDVAGRGVARLRAQVEDVLRFVNYPYLARRAEPFALAELAALAQALQGELGLPPVAVSVADGVAPLRVWPSAEPLALALRELMENARKFHPRRQPALEIQATSPAPGQVSLRVLDDGQALPVEELLRIWQPYYQVEKSLTGEIQGMGLGLSMVAVLLRSAGGSGRAYNRPDRPGLVVELLLPVASL